MIRLNPIMGGSTVLLLAAASALLSGDSSPTNPPRVFVDRCRWGSRPENESLLDTSPRNGTYPENCQQKTRGRYMPPRVPGRTMRP